MKKEQNRERNDHLDRGQEEPEREKTIAKKATWKTCHRDQDDGDEQIKEHKQDKRQVGVGSTWASPHDF